MPVESHQANLVTPANALNQIQELLDQIAQRAEQDLPPQEFYDHLLRLSLQAIAAQGGAVWYHDRKSGFFKTISEVNFPAALTANLPAEEAHAKLLSAALPKEQPQAVPYTLHAEGSAANANDSDFLLLLTPIATEGGQRYLIELALRRSITPAAQSGYLNVLSTLRRVAENYHQRAELRRLRSGEEDWEQLYQFSLDIQRRLNYEETAYAITNGSRDLVGCDRVSLLERRGDYCRALSVSGVDRVDRRSPLIKRLQDFAQSVVVAAEPLWFDENEDLLPPEIEQPLQAFQSESHARRLAVIPLTRQSESKTKQNSAPFATLVFEWMRAETLDDTTRFKITNVAVAASAALQQAMALRAVPFARLTSRWRGDRTDSTGGAWWKRLLISAVVITAALFVGMIPQPFEISSLGELQPVQERRIFAASDGEIEEILVDHGDDCRKGDLLISMTNSQLEFEEKRIEGELQTTRAQLATVRADYLGLDRTAPDSDQRYDQLTAEEQELREKIAGLEAQAAILKTRRNDLAIRSPLDGRVLTWNAEQLLRSRPVRQGQLLLTVADLNGPWRVDLHLDEEDVGYLIAAQDELGTERPVSFILESEPGVTYTGRLEKVSLSTRFDEWDTAGVQLSVTLDPDQQIPQRPGARVRAKIDGGQKALAFVWLHDLYAAVQRWLLF